jgi:hypothetical protein
MTQEKALQALHDENERLGLYKDAYAQPEQEPVGEVGWAANVPNTIREVHWKNGSPPIGTKLFTHPPQRTWVGLTSEEIWDEWIEQSIPERNTHNFVAAFARAIESKLKEVNT